MLRLRFFNVGDGDAILIEEIVGERMFRMLVDTGRDAVPEGDPAATCAAHLQRAGVARLDRVLITHLHVDHYGGLAAILDAGIQIGEVITGYFPLNPGAQMAEEPAAEKTVRNMILHLNAWSLVTARLKELGIPCVELFSTRQNVALTERLTADILLPDLRATRLQRQVWNHMFDGCEETPARKAMASRQRNPNSLRMRLHYAGREIELSGDCFGWVWDKGPVPPCDIFKLPHHGDGKSVTPRLLKKLHPRHAVISASHIYMPEKDRPSRRLAALLRSMGVEVWYTDRFDDGTQPVRPWPSVDFVIHEDGEILPPVAQP